MAYKRYYLFANPYKPETIETVNSTAKALIDRQCIPCLDPWLYDKLGIGEQADLQALPENTEAILSFGGDGTLLRVLPASARQKIPVLGINMGHIGFLLESDPSCMPEALEDLIAKNYDTEERMMMGCFMGGHEKALFINDLALTRGDNPNSIRVKAYADDELIFQTHGDGVLVSTPTGTTGYAISAGGAVIHPKLECVMVLPICSHVLNLRPVVLPIEQTIRLNMVSSKEGSGQLVLDGQRILNPEGKTEIIVQKVPERARFIRLGKQSFLSRLKEKQSVWVQEGDST